MKLKNNLCLRLSKEQLINITKKSEELGMPKSTYCRMAVITYINIVGCINLSLKSPKGAKN
jgi:predicted DNA binding CopG/RHH family protein